MNVEDGGVSAAPLRGSRPRLLAPVRFEIELRRRTHGWVFTALLALAGLTLTYFGGKAATANTLARSQDIRMLESAVKLDPLNPLPHYRLGVFRMYSAERSELFRAIHHLRRAVELNPHSGPFWLALAAASERAGDHRTAEDAIRQALDRRPMSPEYWWRAANFYLRTGQREAAWNHFRRVLELSPGRADLVFRLCYKAAGDFRSVSKNVLPPDGSAALWLAFIDFLRRQGDDEGAFHVWRELASKGPQSDAAFRNVQPYLDALIADNRRDEAMSVWQVLLNWRVVTRPVTSDPRDAVFNGDFEQPPLNGGFDWRVPRTPYVATDLHAPAPFRGTRSASVDFTVKNNEERQILYQYVAVEPGREYQLQAFVRSEGITSDSGPRLRVIDIMSPSRLDAATPPVIGTTDWHPIDLTFTTGPDTRLVRLAVWRPRSRTFPTEISGRFWIDAVSMIATAPPTGLAATREHPFP